MTSSKYVYWLVSLLASFFLGGLAFADSLNTNSTLQMQVLSGTCSNCHGTDGRLAGAVPAIAGRPAGILEAQLLAFKRGEDPKATVMTRHAQGYTDTELAALADYFSKLGR